MAAAPTTGQREATRLGSVPPRAPWYARFSAVKLSKSAAFIKE
jgi:hypothetical protein